MGRTEREAGEEGSKLQGLEMRSRKTSLARALLSSGHSPPPRSWKARPGVQVRGVALQRREADGFWNLPYREEAYNNKGAEPVLNGLSPPFSSPGPSP